MPVIVSTMHDAQALFATCQRLGLQRPQQDTVWVGDREIFGWLVGVPGLNAPIICDLLTGLIAYHPRDNAFHRYRHIMHFVRRYYAVRAELRSPSRRTPCQLQFPRRRRLALSCDAA